MIPPLNAEIPEGISQHFAGILSGITRIVPYGIPSSDYNRDPSRTGTPLEIPSESPPITASRNRLDVSITISRKTLLGFLKELLSWTSPKLLLGFPQMFPMRVLLMFLLE